MTHTQLIEAAKKAINLVFSDTSVAPSTTRESLKDLRDELDVLIDSVPKGRSS